MRGPVIALALLGSLPATAEPLGGQARALDGSTLALGDATVRLWGIDVPDPEQTCHHPDGAAWPCGKLAQLALRVLTKDQPVTCASKGADREGRQTATCALDGGSDLGSMLVSLGYAIDWPGTSGGFYQHEQSLAREARRGLWSGTFDLPWDWRRLHSR